MIKRLLAIALAALPALAATPKLSAAEPRVVSAGALTWGTSPTFVPFEFQQDGKAVGFDVDMMAELGRRIGLNSTMLGMDFAGLVPALSGRRIDAAVSGMYITPARLEVVDMIPYLLIGNQIVAPAGNPAHLTDKNSLCGHHIAVVVNTSFEKSLQAVGAACTAAGNSAIDILSLPNSAAVSLALVQRRAEGAFSSSATVAAMIGQNPGGFVVVGEPFDTDTRLGIGIAKDNPELRQRLETALQAMAQDGTYAALLKKWNLPANSSIF